jgi:hypothetical protein
LIAADDRQESTPTGGPRGARADWLAVLGLLCGIALAVVYVDDFRVYYQAGQRFLEGGWAEVYKPRHLTPFKYHPAFSLLFLPLAVLPWPLAKLLWATLNAFWIWDAGRRFRRSLRIADWQLFVALLFVLPALAWQLKLGNVTFLLLWLMALVVSGGPIQAGGASGLMILLKPFWLPLTLLALLSRRWSTLLAMGATIALLSLLPYLVGGGPTYGDWWVTLTDPTHAHNLPKGDNQTLYGIAYRNREALGALTGWIWFVGSSLSGLLWIGTVLLLERERFELGLLAMVPFILWAAPLSWIHHQIWLWPVLALLLPGSSRIVLLVIWMLLTGTGDVFLSQELARSLHLWGLPTLAYPLIQLLFLARARAWRAA